jgi:hypothetical protein
MNDPHVETLYYLVKQKEDVSYENAQPLLGETDNFHVILNSKEAVFKMKKHFATDQEARTIVDEYLKRYKIIIDIEHSPDELSFVFERSEIIDRNPIVNGCNVILPHITIEEKAAIAGIIIPFQNRVKFPELPKRFALSTDVETLYLRYKLYKEGRELITSMSYMCLTVIQASAEGKNTKEQRENAVKKYNIHPDILKTLGDLCSMKGDRAEARKTTNRNYIPLTPQERNWIESVIKIFIRRLGEYADDPDAHLNLLTMSSLPPL